MDFRMYGRINISKDTDKFHPFEMNTYDSGWVRKNLKFNVIAGDSRHMMTVNALAKSDESNMIYTFTKGSTDDNGNRVKGETIQIPFKERLTSKRLPEVADFRKFIVDLEPYGRREELRKAVDRVKTGENLTDEEMVKLGVKDQSEVAQELTKSEKRHHEFISEWDFIDFIKKVIDSDKYKNSMFYIRGHAEYQYSDKTEKVYETYIPTRIYLSNEHVPEAVASLDFYFGENSLDTGSVDEKGRAYINGYIFERDNNRKANIPVPTTVVILKPSDDAEEKEQKLYKGLVKKFTVSGDNYWKLKVDVDMINGAQQQSVTLEDLPDEVREDIEYGLTTLADVQREMGMTYGERIREYRFKSLGHGQKSKPKEETGFTEDDMKIKPLEDVTDNLFDDDDEL